jgi:hypothetical protein
LTFEPTRTVGITLMYGIGPTVILSMVFSGNLSVRQL